VRAGAGLARHWALAVRRLIVDWPQPELYDRAYAVRLNLVIAAQSGVSAGVSWLIAADLLHHVRPIFAPISAVIVLVGTAGRRLRRAFEMVLGVALGIAVGDGLIFLIGVGAIQIAAVVILAILVAVFLRVGNVAVGQAAASAVLVATLAPPSTGIYYTRFIDSLVGGSVGIVVMALLLPFNPLTRVRKDAGSALSVLGFALVEVAEALETRDDARAERALGTLRAHENEHQKLHDSLTAAQETATIAPIRWRSRPALDRYLAAAVPIERATRNVRVLARRAAIAVRDGESFPGDLGRSLRKLAESVGLLRRELADGLELTPARSLLIEAVKLASAGHRAGVGFSGGVVVAQVRSAALDLLVATGLTESEAGRIVIRARDTRDGA
jgi:uncharacterized membrane protein YgaE (UPF0421/DUF939 family)